MVMLLKVLPSVVCALVATAGVARAATLKQGVALAEIAEHLARRHRGATPPPQIADIVAALTEVAKTLTGHQDTTEAQAQTRGRECKRTLSEHGEFETSIRRGKKMAYEEGNKQQVIKIAIKDHKNKVKEVKESITTALSTIKKLTEQLKTLRANHLKTNKQAKSSLQELNKIITRVVWQEEQQQRHGSTEPAKLKNDVVSLEKLGSQLTTTEDAETPAEDSEIPTEDSEIPTLLQMSTGSSDGAEGADAAREPDAKQQRMIGASGVLQADRAELLQARRSEVRGFEEEEKKLIGLIDAEHKRLEDLEAQLNQEQLVLTDKLKQAAGVGRALAAANRVIKRDSAALASAKQLCSVQFAALKTLLPLRRDVISLVTTPTSLLKSMDTAMFLAKDLKEFQSGPPSFVQLGARSAGVQDASEDSAEGSSEAVQDASDSSEASVDAPSVPAQSAAGDSTGVMRTGMLQQRADAGESGRADSEDGSTGAFDNVISMIKSLMQNLRDQANQDTNLDQWCLESAAEAQRSAHKIQQEQNDVGTQIVWAESEITQLTEEIEYLGTEATRLDKFKGKLVKDQGKENKIVDGQLSDISAALKVLGASISALESICKLKPTTTTTTTTSKPRPGFLLSQAHSHASAGSKNAQCRDAIGLLTQAQQKLSSLDAGLKKYKGTYNQVTGDEITRAGDDAKEQRRALTASTAAKARREHELATAEGDKKQKKQDLLLVEQSMRQTEQKCSVKETHEERMARRQTEIDALKSALKVLNGEGIPA